MKARTKRIYALVVSFVSLGILFSLSVYFLYETVDEAVNLGVVEEELEVEAETLDPGIVMVVFGAIGFLIDAVCLAYAFWWPKYKKRKEEADPEQGNAPAPTTLPTTTTQASVSRSVAVARSRAMRRSTLILKIEPEQRIDNEDITDGETHNINTIAAYAHTV